MKRHTEKSVCPVSRNFYSDISSRVDESLRLSGHAEAVGETMAVIDRYMVCGVIPDKDVANHVLLTFNLLRSEIDKALARSRRARERAAEKARKRGESRVSNVMVTGITENAETSGEGSALSDIVVEPEESENEPAGDDAFVPRNRRERRLYEQELRRAARKAVRRLANRIPA